MPDDARAEPYVLQGPEAPVKPRTTLIGCGGTGCNLIVEGGVEKVNRKMAISSEPNVLKGLAETEPFLVDVGRVEKDARSIVRPSRLTGTETERKLGERLGDIDLAFIVAGLGGSTGGWAAVLAARAAQHQRCTSLCVVSEPFTVEGRKEIAKGQLNLLMEYADGVLVIPNDMIISEAPNLPIAKAFRVMNSVLASPINQLSNSVGKADIKSLSDCFKSSQIFAMDVAEWDGDNATFSIVEQLAKSKWLAFQGRVVKSAILLVQGNHLYEDLVQLGKEFSRATGKKAPLLIGSAGSGEGTLGVTALVGF